MDGEKQAVAGGNGGDGAVFKVQEIQQDRPWSGAQPIRMGIYEGPPAPGKHFCVQQ